MFSNKKSDEKAGAEAPVSKKPRSQAERRGNGNRTALSLWSFAGEQTRTRFVRTAFSNVSEKSGSSRRRDPRVTAENKVFFKIGRPVYKACRGGEL